MSDETHPAIESYFFGKGYRDLKRTVAAASHANYVYAKSNISEGIALFEEGGWNIFITVFRFFVSASVLLFGSIFIIVFSFIHSLVLIVVFSSVYVVFAIFYLIESTIYLVKRISVRCPHCHRDSALPVYLCDTCGRRHHHLRPSRFGIFFHRCRCGKRLPCTMFSNRSRLPSRCRHCDRPLNAKHLSGRKLLVPVYGGPAVGKTAFINACIAKTFTDLQARGLHAEFLDPTTEQENEEIVQHMKQGRMPDKTNDRVPRTINFQITDNKKRLWMVYFYDEAGEVLQGLGGIQGHDFLDSASGLIFLIDPFSLPEVPKMYGQDFRRLQKMVKPSGLAPDLAFERLLLNLETSFGAPRSKKIDIPIVIVLTKIDAGRLESIVGDEALPLGLINQNERDTARNELIRRQLIAWGAQRLIDLVEIRFNNFSYFSVSAIAKNKGDNIGRRISDPIMWILSQYIADMK